MEGEPLILVTNDDGIESKGLWSTVEALLLLGEVMVVAPDQQWSGAGRSMPHGVTGRITPASREIWGEEVTAYAVDASPALAVVHGVLELAPRPPALVVSGINFGANVSIEVTISGTVGAALEAAAFGIPAIAVSLEMDPAYHLTGNDDTDFTTAKAFVWRFARQLLTYALPYDVDVLSINIPANATPKTPWRLTHLSRRRYFSPLPPDRANGDGRPRYELLKDASQTEIASDVRALNGDRIVSVTPLSLDLTSQADFDAIDICLRAKPARRLSRFHINNRRVAMTPVMVREQMVPE